MVGEMADATTLPIDKTVELAGAIAAAGFPSGAISMTDETSKGARNVAQDSWTCMNGQENRKWEGMTILKGHQNMISDKESHKEKF